MNTRFTIHADLNGDRYLNLHEATTKANALLWIRENLATVEDLVWKRWTANLQKNIGEITLEVVDDLSDNVVAIMTPLSIERYPIDCKKDVHEGDIYFDPSNFKTLKSLNRYQVEKIGREHYYVHSPSGTFAIDMEQHKGLGACTCSDYEIRRSPTRLKELEKAKKLGYAIHEDCCHLKHLKFLLARPFGEKTKILVKDLSESGRDPVPANEVTEASSCEVVVKRTAASIKRLKR